MAQTTADILVQRLVDWGVHFPGDGINGIMETLRKQHDKIRFVHVRHEASTAVMAGAYAKHRQVRVCVATSGPGGIHLLNGLYDPS
jgi:pyruvate dehydrogenase (quinone)